MIWIYSIGVKITPSIICWIN